MPLPYIGDAAWLRHYKHGLTRSMLTNKRLPRYAVANPDMAMAMVTDTVMVMEVVGLERPYVGMTLTERTTLF